MKNSLPEPYNSCQQKAFEKICDSIPNREKISLRKHPGQLAGWLTNLVVSLYNR